MSAKQARSLHHLPCFALVFLALHFAASSAHAVGFSSLQGQGVIGQSLQVQAELNGLNESVQEQLRSTCMRATFRGASSGSTGAGGARTVPMTVDFMPTSKGSGFVRLKSKEKLLEPVGDVRLVSECPLAVFDVSWPVLLDPATEPERLYVASSEQQARDTRPDFSFAASDSLALTFKHRGGEAPGGHVSKVRAQAAQVVSSASVGSTSSVAPAAKQLVPAEPLSVQAPISTQEKPDELAMLDQKLMDVNLIQSGPSSSASRAVAADGISPMEPANSIQIDQIPVLIGSCVLVLMGLCVAFWHFQRRRRESAAMPGPVIKKTFDEISERRVIEPSLGGSESEIDEPAPPISDESSSDMSNPLLMGSFLGADQTQSALQDFKAETPSSVLFSADSHQQSLGIALALVNKADTKPWVLPTPYLSLVEERNKVLRLSAEFQARILRSQVGLVELAFQEAKRGRSLEKASMLEFMDTMLQGYALTNIQVGDDAVPEVIKSYLSAKFCEVSGGQAKALLKGNCLALAALAENYPVCFSSPDWAQWVNESCVGV